MPNDNIVNWDITFTHGKKELKDNTVYYNVRTRNEY